MHHNILSALLLGVHPRVLGNDLLVRVRLQPFREERICPHPSERLRVWVSGVWWLVCTQAVVGFG